MANTHPRKFKKKKEKIIKRESWPTLIQEKRNKDIELMEKSTQNKEEQKQTAKTKNKKTKVEKNNNFSFL